MILNEKDVLAHKSAWENKTTVFTNGCFDILHRGHVSYLNKAKALGDVLIVGLNTDHSVRRIKGEKRPIITEEERAFLLDNLKAVDVVILFNDDTPQDLINAVLPDILVKGADYENKEVVGSETVLKHGGKVELIEFVDGLSTTNVIEKISRLYG
jgi:rfaE bifunctional protein nucleotidyltransferase chain/domain